MMAAYTEALNQAAVALKIETPVEQLKAEVATLRSAVKQLQQLIELLLPGYTPLVDVGGEK